LNLYELPGAKGKLISLARRPSGRNGPDVVALTTDLKFAAAAGEGSQVSITDLTSAAKVASFAVTAEVAALAYSADRKVLAAAGVDHSITIWDVSRAANGIVTRVRAMGENALPVSSLEFTADGRSLVEATSESANVWDLGAGTATRSLIVPFEPVRPAFAHLKSVSLSGGGSLLLSRTPSKITLWDTRT